MEDLERGALFTRLLPRCCELDDVTSCDVYCCRSSTLLSYRVMKSDGKTTEIEGDDLKYWRSSGGHLGIILAVEMQFVKETEKGGTLAMKNTFDDFSYVYRCQ